MSLRFLRQLYSLETLDTRFIVPATAPPKEALEEAELDPAKPEPVQNGQNGNYQSRGTIDGVQPSRWKTPEFYAYCLVIGVAVALMLKAVYDVSKASHPNYPKFARLLDDGWIPGRKVDNVDAQYSSFRQNIPYLFIVVLIHPLLRKLYDGLWRADTYTSVPQHRGPGTQLTMGLNTSSAAEARMDQRISFDVGFAVLFICALHGFSAPKIFLILYINYSIAKKVSRQYMPAVTWIFNVGILFLNEIYRGYSYASILYPFVPSIPVGDQTYSTSNVGAYLDKWGGLNSRWEVLFNFTVLRLISFNLDYYWSLNDQRGGAIEKKQLDPSNLSERDRVSIPAKPSDFSFRNYFAYALYSPLYLAGPIVTFNDYMSQCRYKLHSISLNRTALYALRFIVVLLTMEVMIHYLYMVAIFHVKPDWNAYTPLQLSMLGFFNLKHIWLKLLIPWRFFRLWSLLDGIDPPENMVRCMSDNYSVMQFWRGWHRSFNKWSLRYLYIPLGGSAIPGFYGKVRQIISSLLVFSFIAIWHDIQLRLLMWGWLVTLFVLPEIIAGLVFPKSQYRSRPNLYRMICGVGAVANILMLMLANLVGFALGVDGLKDLVHGIMGSYSGLVFFWSACFCLFVGAQVMFEVREEEKRHGIKMKC
ncbi:MBOAT, membrane-bound O-acyltransferase family-domain-containing protein [Lophiotrema nucula]|uniref:MBOAT, membrane-bound O-acyltransferase family-domain-containing protein n=1 Tax=Lophiotrema nucula TaxID=690887 RepID=A0A6A5ZS87_9PLEO|nr:MBOAT, membrane-bound O-acyltransferase family-domain-containing protein [Lophiotrema nucula]